MNEIKVKTLSREYKILMQRNILDEIKLSVQPVFKDLTNIFVITNEKVFSLYGEKLKKSLENDFKSKFLILKDGEKYKSINTLIKIYDWLIENNAHRNDLLIAFGGGVIGDTAGFAAATFNRGMLLLQFPTTLVAQVDSSIGGKVVINFGNIKNVIGSFYQPHLILADPNFLLTLEEKEVINGLGEIVKYGLVFDFTLIEKIKKMIGNNVYDDRLYSLIKSADFDEIIFKCAEIKAEIVEQDEFDIGLRHLLNFGHTIGHAIEETFGFNKISHGKAVALGILCVLDISIKLGYLNKNFKKEILDLYQLLKLPIKIPDVDVNLLLDALKFDKKFTSKTSKFILLEDVNKPVIVTDIDETIIRYSIINNMK